MKEDADIVSIGFTGTQRGMTGDQSATVRRRLQQLYRPGAKFHHGGCVGADAQAAAIARSIGYWTVRHPGDNPDKQEHRFLDDDYRVTLTNLARNRVIVDEVDEMIAAPGENHEVQRSGTWATIRYMRKRDRARTIVWTDGSDSEWMPPT